jgi:hypothetical protein
MTAEQHHEGPDTFGMMQSKVDVNCGSEANGTGARQEPQLYETRYLSRFRRKPTISAVQGARSTALTNVLSPLNLRASPCLPVLEQAIDKSLRR